MEKKARFSCQYLKKSQFLNLRLPTNYHISLNSMFRITEKKKKEKVLIIELVDSTVKKKNNQKLTKNKIKYSFRSKSKHRKFSIKFRTQHFRPYLITMLSIFLSTCSKSNCRQNLFFSFSTNKSRTEILRKKVIRKNFCLNNLYLKKSIQKCYLSIANYCFYSLQEIYVAEFLKDNKTPA